MNLYDDEGFFSSYIALRNEANYNDLMETPAMLSLLGDVEGKRIIEEARVEQGNILKEFP